MRGPQTLNDPGQVLKSVIIVAFFEIGFLMLNHFIFCMFVTCCFFYLL